MRGQIRVLAGVALVAMVGTPEHAEAGQDGDGERRPVFSTSDRERAIHEARKIELRYEAENRGADLELEVREYDGTYEVSVPKTAAKVEAPNPADTIGRMQAQIDELKAAIADGGSSSSTTRASRPRKRAAART